MENSESPTIDLQQIRELLVSQRIELVKRIGDQASRNAALTDISSDRSMMASQAISRESRRSSLARAEQLLELVDQALTRLESGDYGTCLNCGEPIQAGRLYALPYSEYCMHCMEIYESSPVAH